MRIVTLLLVCMAIAPAQIPPDERYKADILLIVAHPDDETAVSAYLARALFDEHRRISVIFGTRGDGGGNAEGNEQAASLGAVREIEGRRALGSWGIANVWFLNGPDTPGQDVLRSLETWNHGATLAQVVRLVRLTRPETILTWLPDYVAGENHGDHQAAGVIATEAFDLAGDPTAFPEQLAAPRNRLDISNLTEGLHAWQPKKLYYFSDASHTEFQEGKGPRYEATAYAKRAAEEMAFHLTQSDTGQVAKAALAKGDLKDFQEPVRLILGKSLVGGVVTGDVFSGVAPGPIPFAASRGYRASQRSGVWMELGGPWAFYRMFWPAHNLDQMHALLPLPEVSIGGTQKLSVAILLHNDTGSAHEVSLTMGEQEVGRYTVPAHETFTVQTSGGPFKGGSGWQEVIWKATVEGAAVEPVRLRVDVGAPGLPQ